MPPWMKVEAKPALPPLALSLGNLFPGPSRLSKPWPAQPQRCWLRFPHFLVFSSLLPQALPALWPSPHPPGTGSQREGVLERGPGRGYREAAQAAAGGGGHCGVTRSPGWGSAQPSPAQPAPGVGFEPIKSWNDPPLWLLPRAASRPFLLCPLYQECSSQTSAPV